jgi:hypothetical protein
MVRNFVLVDDLDQSPGAETIYFTVNGQDYEIDLSEENVQRFNSALQEFVDAARRVARQPASGRGRQSRRQSSGGNSGRDNVAEIRQWAQANGYDVSGRGRIKKEVLAAYDEAHQ